MAFANASNTVYDLCLLPDKIVEDTSMVVVIGGVFKHGQHLAFDPDNPPPLCNLYVNMIQRMGIEADSFGSSTGTLTGLEM